MTRPNRTSPQWLKRALKHVRKGARVSLTQKPFVMSAVRSVQKPEAGPKPRGFWYACETEWLEWVAQSGFSRDYEYLYEVEVDHDKMLVIKTARAFDLFDEAYGVEEIDDIEPKDVFHWINWAAVANEYAGIEICPYQRRRHERDWYAGWDIASGVVWEPTAIVSVEQLL